MDDLAIIGEVYTSLVRTPGALSDDLAADLVDLMPGEKTRSRSSPVSIAWSPDLLTGVDCQAPLPASQRRSRIVGTVRSRAIVVSGRVLQVASTALVRRSDSTRRLPWSHYLNVPGTLELFGPLSADDLVTGFLDVYRSVAVRDPAGLDLPGLNDLLLSRVQKADLQSPATFPARRTRVRWAARVTSRPGQHAQFTLAGNNSRTLGIEFPDSGRLIDMVTPATDFSADLAVHDWLLGTLKDASDRALSGSGQRDRLRRNLDLAMENLFPVWGLGARVDDRLADLWRDLERRAWLERQWNATVDRVRDHLEREQIELQKERIELEKHRIRVEEERLGVERELLKRLRGMDVPGPLAPPRLQEER